MPARTLHRYHAFSQLLRVAGYRSWNPSDSKRGISTRYSLAQSRHSEEELVLVLDLEGS